jgi:egghead protein (zeste-white 4 protein)
MTMSWLMRDINPREVRNAVAFFSIAFLFLHLNGVFFDLAESAKFHERVNEYGIPLAVFLYSLKLLSLMTLPFNIHMLIYTLFWRKEKLLTLKSLPKSCLCFRIVTRGEFPQLVNDNVQRLLDLLKKFEFSNFLIEVVANKAVHLAFHDNDKVRELVVPHDYNTKNGTKYKARSVFRNRMGSNNVC